MARTTLENVSKAVKINSLEMNVGQLHLLFILGDFYDLRYSKLGLQDIVPVSGSNKFNHNFFVSKGNYLRVSLYSLI